MSGRWHPGSQRVMDSDEAKAAAHSLDECYDRFLESEQQSIDRAIANLAKVGMGIQSAKALIWTMLNYLKDNEMLITPVIREEHLGLLCPDCRNCVIESCSSRRIFDETKARVESDLG
jgi:hypothetical protein